jgi:hypothetical protein
MEATSPYRHILVKRVCRTYSNACRLKACFKRRSECGARGACRTGAVKKQRPFFVTLWCDAASPESDAVSPQQYDRTEGEITMIPLVVSGIFIAGLILVEKLCEPSETWKDRKEQQKFRKEREKWVDETVYWNLR